MNSLLLEICVTGTGHQIWKQIKIPVLITCGRYDELGPACAATLQAGIPNAETVVFEESAHVAHIEEPEAYRKTVSEFLTRHDD
ncbi:MAG: hypothetical protein CM1200mP18_16420 [Gammaproteobacteria bacterium]|nr:MAG: hypothetical protein CM1200mP18_16420 [Gammaproteobacteria bacterium]